MRDPVAGASAQSVRSALETAANPRRAALMHDFYKTGPGGYGEGDVFLGLTVPVTRATAKRFADLPFDELDALMVSPVHEHRLCGLVIANAQFARASRSRTRDDAERARLAGWYLAHVHAGHVDNWDLVDASAPYVLGQYLVDRGTSSTGPHAPVLDELAESPDLWQRRVGVVATFAFIRAGDADPTLRLAARLLDDREDLIHKAVGWMLREVGKRVDRAVLTGFLDQHAARMPRTMLSYATEHLGADERAAYRAMR